MRHKRQAYTRKTPPAPAPAAPQEDVGFKTSGLTPAATKYRDNVPVSIHEEMIARHYARDPQTNEIVGDQTIDIMHDAMQAARLSTERAKRIAVAVMANEMATLPARRREVKDKGWRAVEPGPRQLDAARAAAVKEIGRVTALTSAPPRPASPADVMLASEVRARFASMPAKQRAAALAGAVADDTVVAAVLNGPAMLSGISAEEMEMLRHRWRAARHGPDVDRMQRLGRAVEDIDRAGQLAIRFYTGLSSHEIVERAEASERAVQEALRGACPNAAPEGPSPSPGARCGPPGTCRRAARHPNYDWGRCTPLALMRKFPRGFR